MDVSTREEKAPYHVNLTFTSKDEAKELADELARWQPTGGWSNAANALFEALRGER